jgi:hypothetical protein
LFLELRERRSIHHCAAGPELMDMNVYQVRCLPPPHGIGRTARPCGWPTGIQSAADQAEQDHAALKAAVRAGIIDVELEH